MKNGVSNESSRMANDRAERTRDTSASWAAIFSKHVPRAGGQPTVQARQGVSTVLDARKAYCRAERGDKRFLGPPIGRGPLRWPRVRADRRVQCAAVACESIGGGAAGARRFEGPVGRHSDLGPREPCRGRLHPPYDVGNNVRAHPFVAKPAACPPVSPGASCYFTSTARACASR